MFTVKLRIIVIYRFGSPLLFYTTRFVRAGRDRIYCHLRRVR